MGEKHEQGQNVMTQGADVYVCEQIQLQKSY